MIAWGLARHYHTTDESTICHPCTHCMHKKEDMLMKAKYITLLVSLMLGAVQLAFGQNSATVLGFQTDLPNDGNLKPISYKYIEANCGKRKLKRGRFNEAKRLAERMVSAHPSSPKGQDILSFITRNSQSGVQTK